MHGKNNMALPKHEAGSQAPHGPFRARSGEDLAKSREERGGRGGETGGRCRSNSIVSKASKPIDAPWDPLEVRRKLYFFRCRASPHLRQNRHLTPLAVLHTDWSTFLKLTS